MIELTQLGPEARLPQLQEEAADTRPAFPDLTRGARTGRKGGRPSRQQLSGGDATSAEGSTDSGQTDGRSTPSRRQKARKGVSERMRKYWAQRTPRLRIRPNRLAVSGDPSHMSAQRGRTWHLLAPDHEGVERCAFPPPALRPELEYGEVQVRRVRWSVAARANGAERLPPLYCLAFLQSDRIRV